MHVCVVLAGVSPLFLLVVVFYLPFFPDLGNFAWFMSIAFNISLAQECCDFTLADCLNNYLFIYFFSSTFRHLVLPFMTLGTVDHVIIVRWLWFYKPIHSSECLWQDRLCVFLFDKQAVPIAITAFGNISWKTGTLFSFDIHQMAANMLSSAAPASWPPSPFSLIPGQWCNAFWVFHAVAAHQSV